MGNKPARVKVLILGLDNAGKTTAVISFKGHAPSDTPPIPSTSFTVEEVRKAHTTFEIFDVAGGEKVRGLWRHYFEKTRALIFMVDSSDQGRLDEAKEELAKVLQDQEFLAKVPIIILANKMDNLDLKKLCHNREWGVIRTNAKTGEGLDETLKWFALKFKEAKKREKEALKHSKQ